VCAAVVEDGVLNHAVVGQLTVRRSMLANR
jgi:hypothetical protein